MGSSQPKTQTTTSQTTPWGPSQAPLQDIMAQAKTQFDTGVGQKYYDGQTVAPFSGSTMAGLQGISSAANDPNSSSKQVMGLLGTAGGADGGQGTGLLGQLQQPTSSSQNLAGLADKNNVGQLSSTYLQGQDFANQKAQEALTRSLSGVGRFGGNAATAQAFANEIGGQNAQQNAGELARQQQLMLSANGQIDSSNAQNAQLQQGMLGLLPTLDASRYYDAQQQYGVGQAVDAKAQQGIQANLDKYNFENSAKTAALGNYLNFVSGATGNYSNQKATAPGAPQQSGWQTALGTGIGLLGLL